MTAKGAENSAVVKDITEQYPARDRILAASLKLFVEQGYFNTNVPDISRESKCSVGSIYHTFKNKEEIASALYEEAMRAFRAGLIRSVLAENTPEKVIKSLITSFLEFSEANYQLSKYIWLCRHNEFMSGIIKHPTQVGFDKLGRHLTKVIKKAIKSGELKDMPANLIWSALFGIPLAYVRDWLDGYNKVPPSAVVGKISELCWCALRVEKK
jgi:AcrR family transcriptional regulator